MFRSLEGVTLTGAAGPVAVGTVAVLVTKGCQRLPKDAKGGKQPMTASGPVELVNMFDVENSFCAMTWRQLSRLKVQE